MTTDYFAIRERLRSFYQVPTIAPRGEALGADGFLTEVAGRVILTAPASEIGLGLPKELADRWQERAGASSPYLLWLQGRFVEAEKANRNGAFWSTQDLQFGETTVALGPLNWLHEEKSVIGVIADHQIVMPEALELTEAAADGGIMTNPRPFIAAASAVWKWVHPDKVKAIEAAHAGGRLYYSMECIAREMQCVSDETHQGCGKSFDYVTAMTQPDKTCEHIASRSSARRLVDPTFLGGAAIVPPVQPGWGAANVEIMRVAASLAEQTSAACAGDAKASEWEQLMAQVVRFATS